VDNLKHVELMYARGSVFYLGSHPSPMDALNTAVSLFAQLGKDQGVMQAIACEPYQRGVIR